MTDEYDDAVARSLQPATTNPAIAARAGLFFAADTNPDAYAEARRVARRTGVPVDTVLALPAEMKRQDAVGRIDFDTLAETAPATAALLADDALAKMAHDDVENLGQIERKLRQLGGGLVEGVGMATSGTGRLLDVAQRSLAGWAGLLLPTPRAGGSPTLESLAGPLIGDGWRGAGQLAKRFAREDVMVPAAQRTFSDQVAAGLGQVAGQIAMLPLTRGAGLFAQGADAIGEKIDADPAPQWKKDLATLGGSAVTGVTEKWALDRILGPLAAPVKNQVAALLARIGVAAAAEGGQEFAENVLHDVIRQVATNPDAPIDLGQSVGEGEVGATVGGIVRAIVEAGLHVKVRGDRQAQDARRAEQTAEFLDNANKLAASSKLLARDSETFEQFIAQATEDGPVQQVFISANALMQSGVAEQVAAASPAVAAQLGDALQTGGQIAIPVEEYAARIAPTEYAQNLLEHLKAEPEGFSRAEAQEFMQSHAEELQAEVERTLAEKQGDDTFKASAEAVRAEVKAQLDTAARFTPQVNDAYSAMVGNFYAVTAAKVGTTPEELFKRYPLKVGAERIDGPQFAQGGLRIVDVFGNGSRVDHFDDAKGLMYSAQKFPTGTRWTVFEVFPTEDGGDQVLGEMFKYKSLEEAQSAVRGLRISNTQKAKNAAKYGGIPNLWKGEERKVAKALIDAGVGIERFASSTQSKSKYIYLESGLKVRLADHALPSSYDRPDVDYRYGGDIKALVQEVKKAEENAPTPDSRELGSQALSNQDAGATSLRADESGRLVEPAQFEGGAGSEANIAGSYGQSNGARGSFNPASLSITLLKGADLSTFLHESGHFFLEVQADLASKLQQEAEIFGMDTLKPGERQILADTDALLRWFKVRDLAEWQSLDFEEKRAHHENFARGFEAYLFEGKAPSIELQGLFQRFRAWLLHVYKSLKSLDVELNDEVRGVFDRMLASADEIRLAEQGRSMFPLFSSPEAATLTPEEFAAYQALGTEATAHAIDDLQARGLRDMQWLHNARGRAIKRLQKEAAARRAEVQMDVRREVMSQPVYRAWQFLTGKMTADDAVDNPQPPKSDPDTLDETIDSLFVAIAKLGGIDKGETLGTWGIDPADKPASGVFGKPVWRLNGEGRSLDSMREALSQYGWRFDTLQEFEEAFGRELRGDPVYSSRYAPEQFAVGRPGDQVANPAGLTAGRLDLDSLAEIGLPVELVNHLKALRMTAKQGGLHPDLVAEWFGFTSGDEMARTLAAAEAPREEIEALTDVRMLEQFGELSSPDAIARAADKAIHNDARARFVATEANALAKATGQRKVLASAAKEFARAMIARLKVRDIKPGQYANAEVRAAKAAEKASKSGDLATAAAEKRNQLIQNYATRAAYDAQEEVDKGLRYLKKFEGDIKTLDADYADQISNLLERFDLRKGQSNKAVDKRTALAEWIKAQREAGLEPDIPPELENEAFRTSYKNLTVEEFQGLVDTVRQIEHLGRLKHKLLTAADQRAYEAVRDEIAASIHEHAQGREADTRTPTTNMGRAVQGLKRFWAAHIKAATWARVMDGGSDGGPMWEYFIRGANAAGDLETMMRAEATGKLSEILAPVFALGRMGGAGQFFPSIGRSLNREARIALALNIGNEGNLQRLLDGEGWTEAQIAPVLQTLTPQERAAVQAVWDHFESYRPQIAAKERRIYGKEPEWVAPGTALAEALGLRGGYYPIKYDPAASQRAEEHADAESAKRQLQGAYTTATTRRSFTKSRAEEVKGRPLLYTLSGLYSGVNDVIHDLAWHEWLIDANRLLRSHTIDAAIREHYGPEAKQQFKTWVQDVAEGEKGADAAVDLALSRLRQGVSAAGLGFNVMSALIQPLGITQSITRVGAPWVARGVRKYISNPVGLTRTINGMSSFMENRARTRFRELNELRNQVQDQSAFNEYVGRYAYFLMMRCQQMVDVPTWWGAYEKAIAGGNEEARAIALADQAVIDAQGGGQTKDLSAIERGGPAQRLFTVFYTFMNTALNVGAGQTMSANTPAKRAKLAVDYAMLYVVPAVLGYFIKNAFTPGDSGDDDPEKIAKKLLANQIDYLMGLMVVVREFGEAAKIVSGANDMGRDYTGPAGLRLVADTVALAKQAHQGEFDTAFRKAAINVIGDLFGLPSAQVNRTITGTEALVEGKTGNPAAVVFGFQEPR